MNLKEIGDKTQYQQVRNRRQSDSVPFILLLFIDFKFVNNFKTNNEHASISNVALCI